MNNDSIRNLLVFEAVDPVNLAWRVFSAANLIRNKGHEALKNFVEDDDHPIFKKGIELILEDVETDVLSKILKLENSAQCALIGLQNTQPHPPRRARILPKT
mgnify:CR=1 FL=1